MWGHKSCVRQLKFGLVAPLIALMPAKAWSQEISPDKLAAAISSLEDLAQVAVDGGGVPALSIGVVHNDKVVYLKAFGLREAGKPDRADTATVFQIASLSKPVSSTVVAALVSDGLVSWNARIADLDPAFALSDPYPTRELTVRDLFSHRSGLPGTAGDDLEDIGYDRAEILNRLRLVSPSSSFRAGYSYSNFGLTEGAVAAAKQTGKPWEEVAEEKLYRPLGMSSTSSRHDDFIKHANRAALHVKLDGKWVAKVERDPDAQAPAGGVSSTARDLSEWMRLELGNGVYAGNTLISEEAIAQTHVPLMTRGKNPVTGANSFYGLGWNVEFGRHGLTWGHAGAFSVGARSLVTLYPDSGLGMVVLANAFPTGVPEGLSDSFADMVFDGKVGKDWIAAWDAAYSGLFGPAVAAAKATYAKAPAQATPQLANQAYLGRYANSFVGDANVVDVSGGLVLQVGPGGARSYPLQHFDRDIFLAFTSPEMPEMPSAVRFEVGPDGKSSAVVIESLDGNGLGRLTRVGN